MKNILNITIGGLILCLVALYNGFPLVYTDTGTYIGSGFSGDVPIDRTIFYGLFIKHTSVGLSPWLTVLAQSLLLSWVLYRFSKLIFGKEVKDFQFSLVLLLTCLTTGLSFNASILIPDVFTSICALSAYLLLFDTFKSKYSEIFVITVFCFSLSTHLSHIPIALITVGILHFIVSRFNTVVEMNYTLMGNSKPSIYPY